MTKAFNQLPNSITCVNVLAGSVAIVLAARGSDPVGGLTGLQWAWIFIGIAAVADFCDGLAARLLHAYSELGKELDSLCDLVSFGVAPAMVVHYSLRDAGAPEWVGWIPMLIPVAAALRLAKFNLDTRQSTSFLGLPVPANAIFWIGYSALVGSSMPGLSAWWPVMILVLAACALMLGETPLFSLKVSSLKPSRCWRQLTLVVAAVVLVVCLGVGGLAWLIVFYVAFARATARLS